MARHTKGRANGEGTIYEYPKDSGVWYAQISLPDGRRRKRRAPSQRAAREQLRQMQAELAQGVNLAAPQPTVAEWCATWLETFTTNLKPNIRDDYRAVVKRYIADRPIGKQRLQKLTPAEVQSWVNDLTRRLAPKTVRNAYGRLHKALAVAVKQGYVARNVAQGAELPPVPQPKIHPLTIAQVQALLQVVAGHRWYAL